MIKKIFQPFILLFFVLLIACYFRLFLLDTVPVSLSRDEVSIGYNAYSILKTGRDEYGRMFPLAFEAFGDWKLPVSIYATVPFVWLFGLTGIAVRLPVAIAGILSVFFLYLLAEELRKRYTDLKSSFVSILSAFFLAVSPWHIYMSRTAFGHNVIALLFFIIGLLLFLKSLGRKNYLIISAVFFSLTLFTYTAYHLFLPVFLAGLFLLFRKDLNKVKFVKTGAAICLATFILSQAVLWQANTTKIAGSSVTSDSGMIYYRVERKQNEHSNTSLTTKVFHNKYTAIAEQVLQNYISVFSPEFLFVKGGENPINNMEEMGNLYLLDAILIVSGLVFLLRQKREFKWLILLWFLAAPIAGALTRDAPHSTRTFMMTGSLAVIEAMGVAGFFIASFKFNKILKGLLAVLLFVSIVQFTEIYFYHFPKNRAVFWGYGFKETVELSKEQKPKKVIMSKLFDSPYIFFLFYLQYDPQKYQTEAVRDKTTWDGFKPVLGFGKYRFVDRFDWNHIWDKKETLYIDASENIPKNYPIAGEIKYPLGNPVFSWFVTEGDPCRFVYPDIELKPKICP